MARPARAALRPLHQRRVAAAGCGRLLQHGRPLDGRKTRRSRPGHGGGHRRRGEGGARGARCVASALGSCAGALSLRDSAAGAKAFAPARRARDHGQRQTHSREPRHRYSTRRAPFLSPRRMGATSRAGISGLYGLRRCRTDYSVEFSPADARLEDCARPLDRQHGHIEAGGIHSADRAGVRGNLPGDQPASRCGEHRHG